jgi:GR25 family glycosyltransferase involved in LPS biosynthesis
VRAVDGDQLVFNDTFPTFTSSQVRVDVAQSFRCRPKDSNIIACTLSHIRAIQEAYDAGHDFAVISEDDVSWLLSPFWKTSLRQLALRLPERTGATITLFTNFKKKYHHGLNQVGAKWGTQAYLLNRKAMENILTNTIKVDGSFQLLCSTSLIIGIEADNFIYQLAGDRWSVAPTYVYPYNCDISSTLHNSHDRLHMVTAYRALTDAMSAACLQ